MSITEASNSGVSSLAQSASRGEPIALARHGRVIAEVISSEEMAQFRQDREALMEMTLLLTRLATDDGKRTELDEVLGRYGFSRDELEAELIAEHAADAADRS